MEEFNEKVDSLMNRAMYIVVGISSFIVYYITLCPTVYIGDSGEFITNSYTLGINHTTGYPLYTLLASLVIHLLSFATPAVAVNLFSALAASFAVVFVSRMMYLFTGDIIAATGASLVFAFSLTLWQNATIAEIYAFNVMGISLILLLVSDWYYSGRSNPRRILLIAFLSGVLLTHHTTSVLVMVSIALFFIVERKNAFPSSALFVASFLLFVIGASVYLYLPVRSSAEPPLDWLNPESLRNLADYFFPFAGRQVIMHDSDGLMNRLFWTGKRLLTEEMWYYATIAGFSWSWIRQNRSIAILLFSILCLNVILAVFRRQPVEGDFASLLLPSVIIFTLCTGIGIAALRKEIIPSLLRHTITYAAFVFFIPAALFVLHSKQCDKSENRFGEELAGHFFDGVEAHAILFVNGDEQTFLPWYYKYVDGRYKDLSVVNWEMLNTRWHSTAVGKELDMNLLSLSTGEERTKLIVSNYIGKRPIYFLNQIPFQSIFNAYRVEPRGFVNLIRSKTDTTVSEYRLKNFVPTLHASFDERAAFILNYYPRMHLLNAVLLMDNKDFTAAENELNLLLAYTIPSSELLGQQQAAKTLIDSLQNIRKIHLR